jgi:hypothetical protein
MIYSLRPDDEEPLRLLRLLLESIGTYFHPSNGGFWTSRLGQLLRFLVHYLGERLKEGVNLF